MLLCSRDAGGRREITSVDPDRANVIYFAESAHSGIGELVQFLGMNAVQVVDKQNEFIAIYARTVGFDVLEQCRQGVLDPVRPGWVVQESLRDGAGDRVSVGRAEEGDVLDQVRVVAEMGERRGDGGGEDCGCGAGFWGEDFEAS